MGRAITFLIMAAMLLGMPEMMHTLMSTVITDVPTDPTPLGQVATNLQQQMESINSLMGTISYIGGLMFAFKGLLAFKEYAENGGYSHSDTKSNEEQKAEKFTALMETKPEAISLEKEEIKTIVKVIEKEEFKFNLDFENEILNRKLSNIETLINSIVSLPVLEKDVENKVLLSSTQEKYVKQIHNAYIAIPKELRDRDIKGSTATKLALEQLVLVENGLLEMETELLKQQVSDLNIMSRFLKEKFPEHEIATEKKYITLNK